MNERLKILRKELRIVKCALINVKREYGINIHINDYKNAKHYINNIRDRYKKLQEIKQYRSTGMTVFNKKKVINKTKRVK